MTHVIKGQTLSFAADGRAVHESKGAIAIGDDGVILWTGPQPLLPQGFQQVETDDHGDMLVMPGFIDAHIHFPQYRMLAAPGKDLLDWLTRFTFPEESRYADGEYARAAAQLFLSRLFQHGTTSALAFCSVHKACAEALFAAAVSRNMALVTGKTMMDRNAIPAVEDTPETAAALNLGYRRPYGSNGNYWFADADMSYVGERFIEDDNTIWLEAYTNLNLRFGLGNDTWSATLFVDNATDDDKVKSAGSGPGNAFADARAAPRIGTAGALPANLTNPVSAFGLAIPTAVFAEMPRPRTIGLRVNYKF
mgnify:CR=1 FL=1